MNKLARLLRLPSDDELFDLITSSFKNKITEWTYFVDWQKVLQNVAPIEKELNLLNSLVGKEDIEAEAFDLIKTYPQVIRAFPILIAIREESIDVLIEAKNFLYKRYIFNKTDLTDEECL